ncbi:helix-turn-helix domain-containing protein [Streptomyces sp. NPDC001890]|uniref:helix-turn-helix domain-containing protein n=1 Tax=Streptomyces sp. NPDC001890 TaxID=3364620 RepID=UPI0036BB279F
MTDSGQSDRLAAQRQLGAALRALQHRSGLTLRELEKRVPVSDSSLSRYFRGDGVAPWPVVAEICRILGGDPSELRALWQATDRVSPPPQLPATPPAAPTPAPPDDTPRTAAPVPAPAWWRTHPAGQARSRVRVTAVVLTVVLLGAGLTAYGVQLAADFQSGRTTTAALGKEGPRGGADKLQPVFYEAEKARTNQVTVRDATGARSGKAIAHMDYPDSYVEFTVVAASAGPRAMSVRYSNGSQDTAGAPSCASHGLSVNGAVANPVHYTHTGWENWQRTEPVTVALHAGRNTIRFSKGDLFTELDGIELA